jgi:hypothetical protein
VPHHILPSSMSTQASQATRSGTIHYPAKLLVTFSMTEATVDAFAHSSLLHCICIPMYAMQVSGHMHDAVGHSSCYPLSSSAAELLQAHSQALSARLE